MENYQRINGIIQKTASEFQVVVTTGPPKRRKPGPSPDTNAGTQYAPRKWVFNFAGRNSLRRRRETEVR